MVDNRCAEYITPRLDSIPSHDDSVIRVGSYLAVVSEFLSSNVVRPPSPVPSPVLAEILSLARTGRVSGNVTCHFIDI